MKQYSISQVVAGLEMVSPDCTSYLNRLTGEVISCLDDEVMAAEAESMPDDEELPDWEQGRIEQARAVVASDDWLALRGAGAFRRFKDELERLQIRDEWFRYRRQAFVGIARDWLEANELPFDPADNPDADGVL